MSRGGTLKEHYETTGRTYGKSSPLFFRFIGKKGAGLRATCASSSSCAARCVEFLVRSIPVVANDFPSDAMLVLHPLHSPQCVL